MSFWSFIVLVAAFAVLLSAVAVGLRLRALRSSELRFARDRRVEHAPGIGKPKPAPRGAHAPEGPSDLDVRERIRVFSWVVGGAFALLLLRLWGMQLLSGSNYSARAESNLTRSVSIRASRGRIFDRNGYVLVDNRPSMALVADRTVADDSRLVRRIANLLGMPEVAVRHNIQSTSEGAQSLRTIMIDVPQSAVAYVVEHPEQFPGVSVEARSVRSYPFGSVACHLLGYTGTISQEEYDEYAADENNRVEYVLGDIVGKSGVEYQYESVLQGVRGVRTVHVNADGDVTSIVGEVDPEPGSDLRLSIDVKIQVAAERAMHTGVKAATYLGYAPTGGAVVCMDCKTGEVLALASWPNYDPTAFIGGISTDDWAQLISEDANTPLLNRVTDGLYPAASTIKPLSTCAALEYGISTTESSYRCTGFWTGLGEQYGMHCWLHTGHGYMNLHNGITNSCDAVFYEIAKAFYESENPEGLQEMFRRWGLGTATGVDLPGEYRGRVPDAEWKWDWFTWADDAARIWQPGDTANISIGQGDILVTPLQMCYVYCGLVNKGVQMWPHVMLNVLSNETHEPLVYCNEHVQTTVEIDPEILSFVNHAMWGVPNETVIGTYFGGLPVQVMGKSGTGEAGDDDFNTHAWFIAAAPADDPKYVVCSLLEHGGGGGDVTTHMCREVLGAIYDVPMTDPVGLLKMNGVTPETGGTD